MECKPSFVGGGELTTHSRDWSPERKLIPPVMFLDVHHSISYSSVVKAVLSLISPIRRNGKTASVSRPAKM